MMVLHREGLDGCWGWSGPGASNSGGGMHAFN